MMEEEDYYDEYQDDQDFEVEDNEVQRLVKQQDSSGDENYPEQPVTTESAMTQQDFQALLNHKMQLTRQR